MFSTSFSITRLISSFHFLPDCKNISKKFLFKPKIILIFVVREKQTTFAKNKLTSFLKGYQNIFLVMFVTQNRLILLGLNEIFYICEFLVCFSHSINRNCFNLNLLNNGNAKH